MIKSPSERLNTQRGIRYCHGRADIYLQILQHFVAQYDQPQHSAALVAERFAELAALPDEDAIRWLHTLKGHSATIGATALSEQCKTLQADWQQASQVELARQFTALAEALALVCGDVKQVIQLSQQQN